MINCEPLYFTGERFVPEIKNQQLAAEHYQRYLSVSRYVTGKVVLDAACGEGYGSDLLARTASSVIGIDISDEVIRHAHYTYIRDKLTYVMADISDLPVPDNSVDILISFKTIEHVAEPLQAQFLAESRRVLKPAGQLVISTPNRILYSEAIHEVNPFHVHEFTPDEFLTFLTLYFLILRSTSRPPRL